MVVVALYLANRPTAPTNPGTAAPATSSGAPSAPAAQPVASAEPEVPPFYASAEAARPLPKTLPASAFEIPVVARAYRVAERIPTVLAQQPCYCWCDKFGHGSLLDCYKTDHGAG
jgi:hypothetical protein